MTSIKFTLALLLSAPVLALAGPGDKTPRTATERLLTAQRSGELQTQDEQYLSGKVRTEIYQRYVKSFSQPIPDSFAKDSFKEN